MHRRRLIWYAVLAVVLVGVCAVSLFLGDKYAVGRLSVKPVSPDQIATAMEQDEFFSSYREVTLVVRGTVSSVSNNGGALVVGLKTDGSFGVSCDLGNDSQRPVTGDTITVIAEGAKAEREASAVLLHDCVVP